MSAAEKRGGVVSVWADIDAMQKRFNDELAALRSYVWDIDKRSGNSVRMREDGLVVMSFKGFELMAPSVSVLRARFDEHMQKLISEDTARKAAST